MPQIMSDYLTNGWYRFSALTSADIFNKHAAILWQVLRWSNALRRIHCSYEYDLQMCRQVDILVHKTQRGREAMAHQGVWTNCDRVEWSIASLIRWPHSWLENKDFSKFLLGHAAFGFPSEKARTTLSFSIFSIPCCLASAPVADRLLLLSFWWKEKVRCCGHLGIQKRNIYQASCAGNAKTQPEIDACAVPKIAKSSIRYIYPLYY